VLPRRPRAPVVEAEPPAPALEVAKQGEAEPAGGDVGEIGLEGEAVGLGVAEGEPGPPGAGVEDEEREKDLPPPSELDPDVVGHDPIAGVDHHLPGEEGVVRRVLPAGEARAEEPLGKEDLPLVPAGLRGPELDLLVP